MAYIEFKKVCKNYDNYENEIKALKKIDFEADKGQLIILTGPSSSGKKTFLKILSGLDKVTSGDVLIDDVKINELSKRKLLKLRRYEIGFVFKEYGLLENLTLKENIELGYKNPKEKIDVTQIMKKLALTKKKNTLVNMLNEDEKTKAEIARAIIKKPKILLCDDGFDTLEEKGQKQVLKLFKSMSKKDDTTILLITNNEKLHPLSNKVVTFKGGKIVDVKINKKPKAIGDLSW